MVMMYPTSGELVKRLYELLIESGKDRPLSQDEVEAIVWGKAFVAAEERRCQNLLKNS